MITKTMLNNFRKDFAEAVKELESKYNVTIHMGNISYSENSFDAKVNVKENLDEKAAEELAKNDFTRYCSLFGFKPDDYGKEFIAQNKKFKFVGFNPRCPKNACKIVDENGGVYKAPVETVKNALKKGE